MQSVPGTMVRFPIRPAWIDAPDTLYPLFHPQGGGDVETTCQRIG
ncbi:MAG TPA: hypothetical protein PLG62_10120 [Pararhodobacter sp.]|nr:hypothetical protein [Pararhodobacter sp.]HPD92809.1 hypothetical protein [Pararhodobacter sp.]